MGVTVDKILGTPLLHTHSMGDLTGILPVTKGGTGGDNASSAQSNLIGPLSIEDPSDYDGDGSALIPWYDVGGGVNSYSISVASLVAKSTTAPNGTDGLVQFNQGGVFGSASTFHWDAVNSRLRIGSATAAARLHVQTDSTTGIGQITQGVVSQAANLAEWRTSAGTVRSSVTEDGLFSSPCTTGTSFPGERFGRGAAPNVTAGTVGNTVIGQSAGGTISTGSHNTILGFQSGTGLTTGSSNTIIGSQVNVLATTSENVVIGRSINVLAGASRSYMFGVSQTTSHADCIVLGVLATTTKANQILFGRVYSAMTFTGESTVENPPFAEIQRAVVDSTHATRRGRLSLHAYYTTTAQEGLRIEAFSDQARAAIGGVASSGNKLIVYTGAATETGLVVRGSASQIEALQEWQDALGTVVAEVSAAGDVSTAQLLGIGGSLTISNNGSGGSINIAASGGSSVSITSGSPNSVLVNGVEIASSGASPYVIVRNSEDRIAFIIEGFESQTEELQQWKDGYGNVLAAIKSNGALQPGSLDDADAANNTLYYSTTQSKLVYKDGSGAINDLY